MMARLIVLFLLPSESSNLVRSFLPASALSIKSVRNCRRSPSSHQLRQRRRSISSSSFLISRHLHTELTRSRRLNVSTTRLFSSDGSESSASSSATEHRQPSVSKLATSICQPLIKLARRRKEEEREIIVNSEELEQQKLMVILSVSGGCDSIAMLHACMELQQQQQQQHENDVCIEFHVVHFHHQQRDQDADLDCQLVKDLAEEYGLPFVLYDWNTDDYFLESADESISFSQDVARKWRRQRLVDYVTQSIASETNQTTKGIILTAHHKDDSTETMLLKLLRGVHILNLSGMEELTSIQKDDHSIYMVRPWLQYSKQDLMDYLRARNKTWREDTSNASPKYLRNRVRNELLPLLEELSPNIQKRLSVLEHQSSELHSEIQPRVQEYLQDFVVESNDSFAWNGDTTSPLIQSQALYQWINEAMQRQRASIPSSRDDTFVPILSYDALQRVVQQLRNHPDQLEWTMELGGLFNLRRQGKMLQVTHAHREKDASNTTLTLWKWAMVAGNKSGVDEDAEKEDSFIIALPKDLLSSSLQVMQTTVDQYSSLLLSDPNVTAAAATSLRFVPPWKKEGGGKPVKLRQFLRGQGIPIHERDQVPILCITCHSEEKNALHLVAVQIGESWIVHRDNDPAWSPAADNRLLLKIESPS